MKEPRRVGHTGTWLRDAAPLLLKLVTVVAVIVVANLVVGRVIGALDLELRPSNEDMVHRAVVTAAMAYVLLMAIPFVPGIEIGLSLMAMFGPPVVPLVYGCTVLGLTTAFTIGRLIPAHALVRLFDAVHLPRVSTLFTGMEEREMNQRIAYLIEKAPARLVPMLLRHRHLALAVLLNLPGNALVGGGGGIALVAGASRLYSVPGFLATVALSVSPVAIAVAVLGGSFITG